MKECATCRRCFDDSRNHCPDDGKFLTASISGDTTISGRYVLERRLGRGGMGIVFKAKHKFLKSSHALKVISPEIVQQDDTLLTRFRHEAVLAASIQHPNIVSVTDFGVENDVMPFLVMEFIDGVSMAEYLKAQGRLTPAKTLEVLTPMVNGIGEAHEAGIVHRDLKPLNVMIQKGRPLGKAVKVLDFGLAKIKSLESFGSLIQIQTQNVVGTPLYMSPEQWSNDTVDHKADIYSLGVVTFEMLAGDVPFKAESTPAIMYKHLVEKPPTLGSMGADVSPEVEAVIRKALEKEADKRPASVGEFLSEFEAAIKNNNGTVTVSGSTVKITAETVYRDTFDDKNQQTLGSDTDISYLTESQKEKIRPLLKSPNNTANLGAKESLAVEFIEAQQRVEEARDKANEADKLAEEFAEAQRRAEEARRLVVEAQQKVENEVRRRVQAEMEEKLHAEQQARQKAEQEVHRLVEETEVRRAAEVRAAEQAQSALEAQQRAEAERRKAEQEAQQKEFEQGFRRQAEINRAKLAQEAAEARKQYEEARRQAEHETELRREAEAKRQAVEAEIRRVAEEEAARRQAAEIRTQQQIRENANRFEQEAQEAQRKADEARRQAEEEAAKREQAEASQRKAEEEARRLAEEILQAQRRLEQEKAEAQRRLEAVQQQAQEEIHRSKASSSQTRAFDSQAGYDSATRGFDASNPSGENSIGNYQVGATPRLTEDSAVHHSAGVSAPNFAISSGYAAASDAVLPPKKSFPLAVVGGAVALVLVAVLATAGFFLFSPRQTAEIANGAGDNRATNEAVVVGNSGIGTTNTTTAPAALPPRLQNKMIALTGGSFQMGRSDVKPDESEFGVSFPAHSVTVKSFLIDRTEVTNEEYAEFVAATNNVAPGNWKNGKFPLGQERFPVTNIELFDAKAFAQYISDKNKRICRLPTEEEWEYAARSGSQASYFPWGNDWIAGRANVASKSIREVGTSNDKTIVGNVEDMLGNVLEWTSSPYTTYKGHPNPPRQDEVLNTFVIRGTSYKEDRTDKFGLMTSRRLGVKANQKESFVGFRLVCQNSESN